MATGKQSNFGEVIATYVLSKTGVGMFDIEPPTSQNTFTQTYATADRTVAALTYSAPTAQSQDTLTDSSGGTPSTTIAAIGATYDQAEVRNAVASLNAQLVKIKADVATVRTQLVALAADALSMKKNDTAIIDELQRFGNVL